MSETIALVYGTRPQTIKAARLRAALESRWRCLAIDTGQHYDYELNGLVYHQLGVRPPDHVLEIGSGSHATQTAAILLGVERLLSETKVAMLAVIGDTNSTVGGALAALKLRVPVVHVEAGLRGDDPLMPEEINRRIVDASAQVLCAPSMRALARLQSEGAAEESYFTGDIARDVLLSATMEELPAADSWLPPGTPYLLATLHRAELTERPDLLAGILDALRRSPLPVLFPCHPRTLKAIRPLGFDIGNYGNLTITGPVGYLQSVGLVQKSECVITDSGGLQREAYWLGTPCLTLRTKTEWPETVECGANTLVPPVGAPAGLLPAIAHTIVDRRRGDWPRDFYGNGNAAERIVEAIHGYLNQRPARR